MGRKPGRLAAARIAGKDPLLNTKGGHLSQVAMGPERYIHIASAIKHIETISIKADK